MAAGRWVGRGDKNGGDGAAVDAMRALIGTVSMKGVVVIGEGEKDEAPMLFNGEEIGAGGPACDIAVDPIDGTTNFVHGYPHFAVSIALAHGDELLLGDRAVVMTAHPASAKRGSISAAMEASSAAKITLGAPSGVAGATRIPATRAGRPAVRSSRPSSQ